MRYILVFLFFNVSVINFAQKDAFSKLKTNLEMAIINNDEQEESKISTQLVKAYSNATFTYYESVLKKLPHQALLITNGVEDFIPLTILQKSRHINPSVDIVSLKLLNENSTYATTVFAKYKLSNAFDKTSESIYLSRLLSQKVVSVFLSSTIQPYKYSSHTASLFLVGTALEYKCTNQYSQLLGFYTMVSKSVSKPPALTAKEKQLYTNFLPPLLTFYKMEVQSGKENSKLKKQILSFAKYIGKKETVERIINTYSK